MPEQWQRNEYLLTTDPTAVDLAVVHAFLAQSCWARGIPLEVVRRSVEHSLCFSLLRAGALVGFARVVTDYATFAYVGDVFVLPEHRGRGLATWMMGCVVGHPELQGLRRWCLVTRDAANVYARVGFAPSPAPKNWMERLNPDAYRASSRPAE